MSDTSPIFSRSMVLEVSGDSLGVPTPSGKRAAQLAQPFGNALARIVEIDVVGELDLDDRQAGNGFRADGGKPGGAIDGILDRLGDQLLDLLRR